MEGKGGLDMVNAIFALLGTLIGALISTATQIILTRQQIKNQFCLAAIEKRLEAHQTAYELCFKLRSNTHSQLPQKQLLLAEYNQWWLKNCIYLGPKSRKALDNLFREYSLYDPNEHDNAKMQRLVENFKTTFFILISEVGLPSVTQDHQELSHPIAS
jgi:hypothetical protein